MVNGNWGWKLMEIIGITTLAKHEPPLLRGTLGQCSHGSPVAGAEGVLLSSTSLTPRPLAQPVSVLKEFLVVLEVHCHFWPFTAAVRKILPMCLNPLFVKSS